MSPVGVVDVTAVVWPPPKKKILAQSDILCLKRGRRTGKSSHSTTPQFKYVEIVHDEMISDNIITWQTRKCVESN